MKDHLVFRHQYIENNHHIQHTFDRLTRIMCRSRDGSQYKVLQTSEYVQKSVPVLITLIARVQNPEFNWAFS